MEYLIIGIVLLILLLFLGCIFQVSVKKIKKIGINEKLDKIVSQLPENKEVARIMLKKLGNNKVKIKEDKNIKASFYLVATNSILIANIKNSYTRIQTIAHECLHSVQEKRLLWFNYLFANLMLVYYFALVVLTAFGIVHNYYLQFSLLTILLFSQYLVRSFLEIDAMTKARYVAKEYLDVTELEKDQIYEIDKSYQELNKEGIKTVCFQLFAKQIAKLSIYMFLCFFLSVI